MVLIASHLERVQMALDAAMGMHYMHHMNLVHRYNFCGTFHVILTRSRDLKSLNLLVDSDLRIKGISYTRNTNSRRIDSHTKLLILAKHDWFLIWWRLRGAATTGTHNTGARAKFQFPLNYRMAPEVLKTRTYTGKADVFSFGIILWEILTAQKPDRLMSDILVPHPFWYL